MIFLTKVVPDYRGPWGPAFEVLPGIIRFAACEASNRSFGIPQCPKMMGFPQESIAMEEVISVVTLHGCHGLDGLAQGFVSARGVDRVARQGR
jgi:hypothetical protein